MLSNPYGKIYQRVLALCPPVTPTPAWDFLRPGDDCRTTIGDPAEALAALRKDFSDLRLAAAGICEPSPQGGLRLNPALVNPVGAIVALRDHPRRHPFSLVTVRGCLKPKCFSVSAMLKDGWTVRRTMRTGVLFAAFHIGEVAWLRSVDLPAALCFGAHRLSPRELRSLDESFAIAEFGPGSMEEQAPPKRKSEYEEDERVPPFSHPELKAKPSLVLLGWSPLTLSLAASPLLRRTAEYLTAVRRYLGLPFRGVMVWRPSAEQLENLRFRLALRNKKLIREWLRESSDELYDVEHFTGADAFPAFEPRPAGIADARAALLREFATDRGRQPLSQRVEAARQRYNELVDSDLVRPLREWAQGNEHPVIRSVGQELASVAGLLHEMSPTIHELVRRQLESDLRGEADSNLSMPLARFLQLMNRHGALLRDLKRWDKWI